MFTDHSSEAGLELTFRSCPSVPDLERIDDALPETTRPGGPRFRVVQAAKRRESAPDTYFDGRNSHRRLAEIDWSDHEVIRLSALLSNRHTRRENAIPSCRHP